MSDRSFGVGGLVSGGPFFTGGVLVVDVPGRFDVGLNGVGFMLDRKPREHKHRPTQILRQQADNSQRPSEASINPQDYWRSAADSWHMGAGQVFFDRPNSDPLGARFRQSKGVDVWTENEISLLPATFEGRDSANTNLRMAVAGSRLYFIDGTTLGFTTDPTASTWTTTTVTSTAGTLISLASDGFHVWATSGANVYQTDTSATSATTLDTEDIDVLGYVKGRLMGAEDNEIFYWNGSDFISLFAHGNTNFSWVGFAEGQAHIYAAGFSGDKSLIYRIAVKPDGTALDQPINAGQLPDGEIIYSIGGYLGKIFLGTSKGARFCDVDGQGNLIIGRLIMTTSPVRCFEGQENFVWAGLTNYDATSTGLLRMDLSKFAGDPADQRLAYATDLMATAQGNVLDVCTFGDKRYFAVSGAGFQCQSTSKVVEATIDSGWITYGLPDPKIAMFLALRFGANMAGSVTGSIAIDGSTTFTDVGTHTAGSPDDSGDIFPCNETGAERFEVRLTLARDSGAPTTGPTITRRTLRSQPAPAMTKLVTLPLRIEERFYDKGNSECTRDPAATIASLETLHASKDVFSVQEGSEAYSALMEDFEVHLLDATEEATYPGAWNAVFYAVLKRDQ